jgi:histidine ammonia-lyase
MGSISGRKLNQVIGNVENILAIELLYAAQAVDFRRPLKSSPVLEAVHALVRSKVTFAKEDRIFSKDIQALQKIIVEGLLVKCANDFLVKNNIVMDN